MVVASRASRRILLIGAYERDNFGDLLFYHVTRAFFASNFIKAASIVEPHHSWRPGFEISPYNAALADERWDLVWVVGGEVGGVDLRGALAMSLHEEEARIFHKAEAGRQQAIIRFLVNAEPTDPAYLPIMERFPGNASTPLVLNSVGIGNIELLRGTEQYDRSVAILHDAAAVSVRDRRSRDFAETVGAPAYFAPDIVHSISRTLPAVASSAKSEDDYFVFQINAGVFGRTDRAELVDQLLQIYRATALSPVLFPAGLALHHDSLADYEALRVDMTAAMPGCGVRVVSTRDPLELSGIIANAKLWVGTSLHGRIVSSSYGIARVSIENTKTATYAMTWDPIFPSGVEISGIASEALLALDLAQLSSSREASEELTRLAVSATEQIVKDVL